MKEIVSGYKLKLENFDHEFHHSVWAIWTDNVTNNTHGSISTEENTTGPDLTTAELTDISTTATDLKLTTMNDEITTGPRLKIAESTYIFTTLAYLIYHNLDQ